MVVCVLVDDFRRRVVSAVYDAVAGMAYVFFFGDRGEGFVRD